MSILVMALCNQPEALAADLGATSYVTCSEAKVSVPGASNKLGE